MVARWVDLDLECGFGDVDFLTVEAVSRSDVLVPHQLSYMANVPSLVKHMV